MCERGWGEGEIEGEEVCERDNERGSGRET